MLLRRPENEDRGWSLLIFQQTFQGQIDVTGHGPSCMSHPVQRALLTATLSSCSHGLHGFPYPFVRNLLFILPG